MDNFLKTVEQINGVLNNFIWGPYMLVFFLLVGGMFTIRTSFFQITRIKNWMEVTILSVFKDRKVLKTEDRHSISQFQSLCTAGGYHRHRQHRRCGHRHCPWRSGSGILDVAVCFSGHDDQLCREYAGY